MSRTLSKALLATTAFVAGVSGSANAVVQVVSTSSTTPYTTSDTAGGLRVSAVGEISATGTAAIEISSSTADDNSLTINTGAVVKNGGTGTTSATILYTGTGDGASVTINNSGTISTLKGTAAIDLTGSNGSIVANTGSISGSVSTGAGDDTFTQASGAVTGTVALGAGANTFSMTGGTLTGDVTAGAGNDTFTISSGSISTTSAGINLGNGTNTITRSGGTIAGAIVGGSGTDTLNISGTTAFTTGGAISNVENINISNTVHIRHGITAADTVRIGAGAVANVSSGFATGTNGNVLVSGTLNMAARQIVSATNLNFNRGVLGITLDSSNTTTGALDADSASKLVIEDTTGSFRGGSVTINLGTTVGYIASGTTYRIVSSTASGAPVTPSLTTSTNGGLYTYRIARVGSTGSVSLTIERAATSSLATSSVGKAVAAQLDSIGTSARGDMLTVQQRLNAAGSASAVNDIVESLAPGANTAAGLAVVDVAASTGNNVSTRLASLRQAGVATGDKAASNHVWVQGFGTASTQDAKNGNPGYDLTSGGATFGADTDTLVDGVTTGMAFSYANSSVDGDAASNPQTDVDSYLLSMYGSQVLGDGLFVNGQAGLGYNKYDFSRRVSGFSTDTKGDTHGAQLTLKGEVGKDFQVDAFTLTPLASAQYTYLNMKKYTETGPAALEVDPEALGALDLGIGGQAAWNYALDGGETVRPMLRAKYVYRAGDAGLDTTSRFVAGGTAFDTKGAKADRSSFNVGAGLTLTDVIGADVTVDYDADIRSSYVGHTGQLKAKWAF